MWQIFVHWIVIPDLKGKICVMITAVCQPRSLPIQIHCRMARSLNLTNVHVQSNFDLQSLSAFAGVDLTSAYTCTGVVRRLCTETAVSGKLPSNNISCKLMVL